MRCKRFRKVLLDSHHFGRVVTVHRATDIALNAEGTIERWNRHVSIGKAKRYAVSEQEILHQMIHVVLAKDDPAVVAIFPHTPPSALEERLGRAIARIVADRKGNYQGLGFYRDLT
jgi:hypothetical protein